MATYKPIRKTASGTEEIKIPYAVLADAPDLSKYVTTDTAQTISGAKTFTAQPIINTSNGLKFTSGNCALRIYNTSASPTDYAVIEARSNNSTKRNLFVDLDINSLVVGQPSGTTDTTYKVNVKDTFNATKIYENGTSLSDKYLGKTAKAADADKLDGNNSSYYLNYDNLSNTPTILSEADVKGIKVDNAVNADTAEKVKQSLKIYYKTHPQVSYSADDYNGSTARDLAFDQQFFQGYSLEEEGHKFSRAIGLKPTGVTAGTYNSVRVDRYGRVTEGTNTPAVDTSNLAKLDTENTFTKGQVITGRTSGGYSINASGYVKGSWLQSSVMSNKGANTGMVCVFDGNGWIYYRTPSEILSEASGVPKSAFSLSGTTLTITI